MRERRPQLGTGRLYERLCDIFLASNLQTIRTYLSKKYASAYLRVTWPDLTKDCWVMFHNLYYLRIHITEQLVIMVLQLKIINLFSAFQYVTHKLPELKKRILLFHWSLL